MAIKSQGESTKAPLSFDKCVEWVVAAGSPTLSIDRDRGAYEEARKIFAETGKLDAALERLATPVLPGGYHRRELFRPVFRLTILLFLFVAFVVLACRTWVPDVASYYDEVNQTQSPWIGWLLWFQETASPYTVLIGFVFLMVLFSLVRGAPWKIPLGLPGRKRYQQACDRYHQARWMQMIHPQDAWEVTGMLARTRAVMIATTWRHGVPLFFGVVLGGALVFGYALSLFLPLVQLIQDLSLPNVMSGRSW